MNIQRVSPNVPVDKFLQAIAELTPLPRIIRYEDDYDEVVRSINVAESIESVTIYASGQKATLNFLRFNERIRPLLRAYLLFSLQELATISISGNFQTLTKLLPSDIEFAATSEPLKLAQLWPELVAKYHYSSLLALRGLLSFLCAVRFLSWAPTHSQFVSRAFPVRRPDSYAVVRSGDAFIRIDDEAKLVRWIDAAALDAPTMNQTAVELACVVASSYQFGMRPKQMGVLRKRDCSIRISLEDKSVIVHLTFRLLKQRDEVLAKVPLVRKVKREWVPLFVRLMDLKLNDHADTFLFGFASRSELSRALISALDEIAPDGELRAYDLRHSMAQRLVDAGSSHEDLAAAMGHTSLATGLIYFRQSANQAELVNKALGLSDVYQVVARISRNKYLSPEELADLKGDQQIAGVPHGIPIAGIGGCKTGQPSCPYNPVTACYGCPKFIAVSDIKLHRHVLDVFRGVVNQYRLVGKGEDTTPAFLQLQRTVSKINDVIRDLEGLHEE